MDNTGTNDGMIYTGDGTAIIGVPARDLSKEEVEQYGKSRLLASGLYRETVQEVKRVFTPKPRKAAFKGGIEAEKEN